MKSRVFIIKKEDGFEYALMPNVVNCLQSEDYDGSPFQLIKSKIGNIYIFYAGEYIDTVYLKILLNNELKDKQIDIHYLLNELSFKIKEELKRVYRVCTSDNDGEYMFGNILIIQNDVCYHINSRFIVKSKSIYLDDGLISARVLYNNSMSLKELLYKLYEEPKQKYIYPMIFGNTKINEITIKDENEEKIVSEDCFICQL